MSSKNTIPEFLSLTIPEAAILFPNSKSNCFQIENRNPDVIYFMIGNPQYKKVDRHNKIRSVVNCLKFNKNNGLLILTTIGIKNEEKIVALELGDFFDLVKKKAETLEKNNIHYKTYIQYGFIKSEGIEDIL